MSDEAKQLVERLVANGSATRRRRPVLLWIHEWDQLSEREQEVIRAARARAYGELQADRARREDAKRRRKREEGSERAQRRRAARESASVTSWLLRYHGGRYREMSVLERTAWREAYRKSRLPAAGAWGVSLLPALAIAFALSNTLAGIVTYVLLVSLSYASRRVLVSRRARRLIQQFEEARRRSRNIPSQVRDAVLRRDHHRCVYCGSAQDLQLDHIKPWSRGGESTEQNLQTLCAGCNLAKNTMPDEEARRRLGHFD